MKISEKIMGVTLILIFTLGIFLSIYIGIWETTETQNKKIVLQDNMETLLPDEIKGSYTFDEISEIFGINIEILYEAFNIPKDMQSSMLKVKDIESLYTDEEFEIGKESMVAFVSLYKNIPITLTDTYLPKEAIEIIYKYNEDISEEEYNYLESHKI